jgi:hypothetical protein
LLFSITRFFSVSGPVTATERASAQLFTVDAKRVDSEVTEWFLRHLGHVSPPAEAVCSTRDTSGARTEVEPS